MLNSQDAVATRLNIAIEAAGITQSKLALAVGASQPAVSQWLTGRKVPSGDNLDALAGALRVNRDWLMTGAGRMKVPNPAADRVEYQTQAIWDFRPAPLDGGRDFGNANVWSFDPGLDVLVREVLQNARDAALTPDRRVDVVFRIIRLTGADKQDYLAALKWSSLKQHLESSAASGQKLGTLIRDGLERVDGEDLLLLAIEDSGTVGLTGPERDESNFTALCRNNLDSNKKEGTKGGAFGLGKAVLWRASRLSTVTFSSNLSQPMEGKSLCRLIGRCELAWHKVDLEKYAGPGWFGRRSEDETASSFWENETLAQDLYVDREETGATVCVVGFHDASADRDRSPTDLAQDLVRAAAENFFPALVMDRLAVRVEVYDSRRQYVDRRPAFSRGVNPEEFTPAYVKMLRSYRDGTSVAQLGENGEVASRVVTLSVPKRTVDPKHNEQDHSAVLLVTTADDEAAVGDGCSDRINQLAMFRGPGMVVQFKSLDGVCLGARPFHSLLLCGKAPEFAADRPRSSLQVDNAAEQFLRTSEPPSHNQWTATPDLKAIYARGCKAKLDQLMKAAAEAVRDLVKPVPKDTGDGPQSIKELFRIGADPVPNERPRVVEQAGKVDAAGRWLVTARIRLKPRRTRLSLSPAVYFLAETGAGVAVDWELLETKSPGCIVKGESLLLPAETREVRFSGVTDPRSHPVPASESCVVVDIKSERAVSALEVES
jgi:transcriptional regulator with XRE-family HTH domain